MPQYNEREYRALGVSLSAAAVGNNKRFDSDFYVEGYATTFEKPYMLYEYKGMKVYETIGRNALAGTDMRDVIMRYDHKGKVLARIANNTLGLEADETGLFTFADLSKSHAARRLYEEIENGLITQMSWAFRVADKGDTFDKDTQKGIIMRTINRFQKVFDVSAVGIPANADASITARSYLDGVIEMEKREALARRAALLRLKLLLGV